MGDGRAARGLAAARRAARGVGLAVGFAVGLLGTAGCPRKESRPAPPPMPAKVALPDGGTRHTERLAPAIWHGDEVAVCGNRPSPTRAIGPRRECVGARLGAPLSPAAMVPWLDDPTLTRDVSPPDTAPGACRILVDDLGADRLARPGAAATLALVGPAATLPLGRWVPDLDVMGDYFAYEASYSPDGRWLALARLSVGIGEGERTVEVIALEVRAAPPCR